MSSRFDVAGEQRRKISRMFGDSLQDLAPARHATDKVRSVPGRAPHFFDIATQQFVFAREDWLARDAFATQGLFDDLEIRHTRTHHGAERTRRAKNSFEHRHGVILEHTVTLPA